MSLWFFWGNDHLTFLRWMTLESARRVHNDVILVRRRDPVPKQAVPWDERQDFQFEGGGRNWMHELPAGVKTVWLEDVAPDIAALKAPDVQTSDIVGWWALAHHGGSIADMDVVFTKPIPEVTHDIHMVYCTGHPKQGYTPIGFLQGRPCDFWMRLYRASIERYNPHVYQSSGANVVPPWSEVPEPKTLLPETIVYPWAIRAPWLDWHAWMFTAPEWPEIPPECCGIHWYGGQNQVYNQAMTEDRVRRMPGAVAHAIRQILGSTAQVP